MSILTDEQIKALNDFARTHPHLAKTFDYLSSGTKEGLGDALNDDDADSELTVAQSDGKASFSGITTLKFEASAFYITQNANPNEAQVNFRGTASGGSSGGVTDHGALTGLLDDDHPQYILVDGTRAFTGNQSLDGNRITNVGAPVVATDAARLGDIGPGFYGVIVKDGSHTFTDNVISFNNSQFYLTKDSAGNPEVNLVKDRIWALHGHFVDVPNQKITVIHFAPTAMRIDYIAGKVGTGGVGLVLKQATGHVTWPGSGSFDEIYFYSFQKIYRPSANNIVPLGGRVQMDMFYLVSNNTTDFEWTLAGIEI